jgi:hypothetical protein
MSMKIFKYQQHEGGVFTKTNNLLNIQLPAMEGSTSLSTAYLELEKVSFKDQTGLQITDNVALGFVNGENAVVYDTSAFIKNMKITSEKQPLIEEVRFVNRRTQTQKNLFKGQTTARNEFFTGRGGVVLLDDNGQCNLQIPLSSVCGFGSVQAVDMTSMTGAVNFQIELENQHTLALEYMQGFELTEIPCDDIENDTEEVDAVSSILITSTFQSEGTAIMMFPLGSRVTLSYTHSTDGAGTADVFVESLEYDEATNKLAVIFTESFVDLAPTESLTDITLSNEVVSYTGANGAGATVLVNPLPDYPFTFPVGMTLQVMYLDNGQYHVITGQVLTAVPQDDNVLITFTYPIFPDGSNPTDIRLAVYGLQNLDYEIEKVNLVFRNNPMGIVDSKAIVFDTYHVEMANMMDGLYDYRQQFDIEPGVRRLEWLTCIDNLVSNVDTATSYRVSVNELDTTNRDVELVGTKALYYDRLVEAYSELVNLNLVDFSQTVLVVPETVIPQDSRLMVNLRLYASGQPMQTKIVYLYKLLSVKLM